jgi:hypothetical protein
MTKINEINHIIDCILKKGYDKYTNNNINKGNLNNFLDEVLELIDGTNIIDTFYTSYGGSSASNITSEIIKFMFLNVLNVNDENNLNEIKNLCKHIDNTLKNFFTKHNIAIKNFSYMQTLWEIIDDERLSFNSNDQSLEFYFLINLYVISLYCKDLYNDKQNKKRREKDLIFLESKGYKRETIKRNFFIVLGILLITIVLLVVIKIVVIRRYPNANENTSEFFMALLLYFIYVILVFVIIILLLPMLLYSILYLIFIFTNINLCLFLNVRFYAIMINISTLQISRNLEKVQEDYSKKLSNTIKTTS